MAQETDATSEQETQSDEDLAVRAGEGDQAAFAALYDRHFGEIYDSAVRTLRDPEAAAAAVETAFTRAWDSMRKGRFGNNVKAWLYTVARASAIDGLRRNRRTISGAVPRPGGAAPAFAELDPSRMPAAPEPPEDEETAEIVWRSAVALSPKQYSLLDLHLRRGLTADELAESLRLTRGHVYTMLTRLREALSESAAYTYLMRRGRAECRELDYLLSDIKVVEYNRETRRAIQDHLKTCARCQARRRGNASPLAVFAGLALVPAGHGVQAGVWRGVLAHISGIPAAPGRAGLTHTHVRGAARLSPPLAAAAIAGLLTLIAVPLAGVLVFGSSGGGGTATVRDPDDVHSTDREPGEPSSDDTIEVEWTAVPGAQAYSMMWTQGRTDLPDTEGDLPGSATGTESPRLEPGTWYFHLRTQGEDGRWTSTVHLGPFEVIKDGDDDAEPSATKAPSPSPEPEETPVPSPDFPAPTAPPATDTPAPTPAATATPAPQATPTETPPAPEESPTPTPPP